MRKVAVVTGTRAEYGLLYYLLRAIDQDSEIQLQLIVTGAHLSAEHGHTIDQIYQDGLEVAAKVDILKFENTSVGIAKSVGLGVSEFASTYASLRPDIVVVLGDRYEILAAAQAAMLMNIPIAHIHGGELSEGALDDSIRHSISKMASLHFPVAEVYRKRLIQLGESPDRIINVGAPGLEFIRKTARLSKTELEASLGFQFGETNFLVTYHPATINLEESLQECEAMLTALSSFKSVKIIFTKSNADEGGLVVNQLLEDYVTANPQQSVVYDSLGSVRYVSALSYMDMVIGNSSSGLIEVPAFKIPTVNIGHRQDARLKASSVIDCEGNELAIKNAIQEGLKMNCSDTVSLYGKGECSAAILSVLTSVDLATLTKKQFYDLNHEVCV